MKRIDLFPGIIEVWSKGTFIFGYRPIKDYYIVDSPTLVYTPQSSKSIQVHFEVDGISKEENYYVGLFQNENSEQAEQVKKITLENLEGNTIFEVDENINHYYIYMTDENGKKLDDNHFQYEGNVIDFSKMQIANVANIITDKSVVSSVKSGNLDLDGGETDIEETTGTGESNYIDNVLNDNKIYMAQVNICKTYEVERINLNIEKVWEDQDNIKNSRPDQVEVVVFANEKEIEKITLNSKNNWKYVIKDLAKNDEEGNAIQYSVKEETVNGYNTKVEINNNNIKIINTIQENADTSDIQIWVYVAIGVCSILVIAMLVVLMIMRKKNKNK